MPFVRKSTSVAVPNGGKLFELYLEQFATVGIHRRYRKELKRAEGQGQTAIADAEFEAIKALISDQYTAMLQQRVSAFSTNNRRQDFMWTMLAEHGGMSQRTRDMFAPRASLLKRDLYLKMRKAEIEATMQQLK